MEHFTPPQVGKYLNSKMIPLVVGGIFLVALLGTSVYIVDQAEEAVITRFGRYVTTKGPGLQFRLPFGIEKNYTINVRAVQSEDFGYRTLRGGRNPNYSSNASEATMLTGDLNIVDVEWNIQYRIVDPRAWVFNYLLDERILTIRDVSRSVINMLVGDRAIMDVIGSERNAIMAEGIVAMNEIFRDYGLGIDVIAVQLQNAVAPAGVQQAFDDVNKATQDKERLINEGQQAYNEEIPKARGEAERLIQIAQGYATERVNRAQGDVARFNSVRNEYQRAPEVTRQRLYYEMIEEVFKNEEGTTLIDRNLDNFLPMMNMGGNR